jgi:hypothetical protein
MQTEMRSAECSERAETSTLCPPPEARFVRSAGSTGAGRGAGCGKTDLRRAVRPPRASSASTDTDFPSALPGAPVALGARSLRRAPPYPPPRHPALPPRFRITDSSG